MHVALSYSASSRKFRLRLDAESAEATAKRESGLESFSELRIGHPGSSGSGGSFLGQVSEVRLWAAARSPEEIEAHRYERCCKGWDPSIK